MSPRQPDFDPTAVGELATRLLGFGTRYKLDGFLKAHGIMIDDYTADDLRREVADLQRLGF